MTALQLFERTPFDILVRDFFQTANQFHTLENFKVPHPVDIYETENGLTFEIACTGIPKEEIDILIQDNVLRVNYDKKKVEETPEYLYRGIAKRSFNLGWKVASRFNLSQAEAEFKDGLLTISIPYSKGSELKTLKIK